MAANPGRKALPEPPRPRQGWLRWLLCLGHDPTDVRTRFGGGVGFAELQLRAGSGSFSLVHYYTNGVFCPLCLFYSPSFKGR